MNGTHDVFFVDYAQVVSFCGSIAITIAGVVLNTLVIVCLVKYAPRIRNETSTKFVVNLAVADLMFSSMAIPLNSIWFYYRSDPFLGVVTCQMFLIVYYFDFTLTVLSLAFVTFNR